MQRPFNFLTTSHQRQRRVLWALAMLSWIVAVLCGRTITTRQDRQRGHVTLDGLTRLTMRLMIVRAAELVGLRKRHQRFYKYGRDRRPAHIYRRVLGSKLRRAFTHKDLAKRISALIHTLRNLDRFARQLGARMKRGLTRLWAILATPAPSAPLLGIGTLALASNDSS